MLEGAFNLKLKKALEAHPALKSAWVVKHNDMSTGGIPDLSVTIGARTIWIEVKLEGRALTPLQSVTLAKIKDGGALIVAERDGKTARLYCDENCSALMAHSNRSLWFSELVDEIAARCVTVRT